MIYNDIGVFLKALENVTDTTVLANPKVLVLNKQQGEVHVGKNIGYKTAVATETLTASSITFLDTGLRLFFRPHTGEGGSIRPAMRPDSAAGSSQPHGTT